MRLSRKKPAYLKMMDISARSLHVKRVVISKLMNEGLYPYTKRYLGTMAAMLRFTERQATAILEMRLYKLIGLELEALMKEHEETLKN
ncbi:hypothetical protein NE575_19660, partial [Clostridium sp. SL.3.18]|nr:hypothetical protein [Clostridium sp. SL.3.18]